MQRNMFNYKHNGYESESIDLPFEVDQQIHNPYSDSSHIINEFVDLKNLDLADYGCEIHLMLCMELYYFIHR